MSGPSANSGAWVPGYVPPLAEFLAGHMVAAPGERMDWADVYCAFVAAPWGCVPQPQAVAAALAWICRAKGIKVEVDGGSVYCVDCALQ